MSLILENVTGGYGHLAVLKDISFRVNPGEMVGMIGLNGAGKSTTIKHIIGLLEQKKGTISINDLTLKKNTEAYRKQIGYIPETPSLYEELTLREHIEITAMAYDIPLETAMRRAKKLLHTFRLENRLEWFPANFSKGMKQKVMICCALMTNAKLLIVDEPFYGLDPLAVHDLLELIEERKKAGTAVLMSTHVLDTAQRYCDRFVLLANGKVRARGTLDELRQKADKPDESLDDIYLSLARDDQNE